MYTNVYYCSRWRFIFSPEQRFTAIEHFARMRHQQDAFRLTAGPLLWVKRVVVRIPQVDPPVAFLRNTRRPSVDGCPARSDSPAAPPATQSARTMHETAAGSVQCECHPGRSPAPVCRPMALVLARVPTALGHARHSV